MGRSFSLAIRMMFYLLASTTVHAQTGAKPIKEFAVEGVTSASLDRLGNLYLVFEKGIIRKYDTDGNFLNEFTNPNHKVITLLEPWNPLRVFVYDHTAQEIILLDRALQPLDKISIDPSLAIEPALVSPTSNNGYWILDGADFTLKKIDPSSRNVLFEVKPKRTSPVKPIFTYLREYQNQLLLVDQETGVEILSVTGKSIRSFPVKSLRFLGLLGPEIYYLESGKVKLFDLYSEEQRELKVDPAAEIVLLTDERMLVVKKTKVEVWEYKP